MNTKILGILKTLLTIFILIGAITTVSGAEDVTLDIEFDDSSIKPGDDAILFVEIENEENDDISVDVEIWDDDKDERLERDIVSIADGETKTINYTLNDFSEWNPYDCGNRTIRVEVENEEKTDTLTISGDDFIINISPSEPSVDNEITITIKDNDSYEVEEEYIIITNLDTNNSIKEKTDDYGIVKFTPINESTFNDSPAGDYEVMVDNENDRIEEGYCNTRKNFIVKYDDENGLKLDVSKDSEPEPRIGNEITIHADLENTGASNITNINVIMRTLYEDICSKTVSNISAGNTTRVSCKWNITKNISCGQNIIFIGANSGGYSLSNTIHITVSGKYYNMVLEPDSPEIDEELKITIKDEDGKVVNGTKILLFKIFRIPGGAQREDPVDIGDVYTENGQAVIIINETGRYKILAEYEREFYCKSVYREREVLDIFIIYGLKPTYGLDDDFDILVTDKNNNTVDIQVNFRGLSNSIYRYYETQNGVLTFNFRQAGFEEGDYSVYFGEDPLQPSNYHAVNEKIRLVAEEVEYCTSCLTCMEKLSDSNCSTVKLNNSITHNGTCIYNPINFNNKVFDCQGNTISGDGWGGYGIALNNKENNTIINCTITEFDKGIYIYSSSSNTLTSNTVDDNVYGIYLDSNSDFNDLINNNIRNNTNTGVYFFSDSNNNSLKRNFICGNGLDVDNTDSNSGNKNTCDTINNWNDIGINGCWYTCSGLLRICDINNDGIYIKDYSELMSAYKYFLGINKNCNDYYQNWNLIKQEYQCFIK